MAPGDSGAAMRTSQLNMQSGAREAQYGFQGKAALGQGLGQGISQGAASAVQNFYKQKELEEKLLDGQMRRAANQRSLEQYDQRTKILHSELALTAAKNEVDARRNEINFQKLQFDQTFKAQGRETDIRQFAAQQAGKVRFNEKGEPMIYNAAMKGFEVMSPDAYKRYQKASPEHRKLAVDEGGLELRQRAEDRAGRKASSEEAYREAMTKRVLAEIARDKDLAPFEKQKLVMAILRAGEPRPRDEEAKELDRAHARYYDRRDSGGGILGSQDDLSKGVAGNAASGATSTPVAAPPTPKRSVREAFDTVLRGDRNLEEAAPGVNLESAFAEFVQKARERGDRSSSAKELAEIFANLVRSRAGSGIR